MKINSFQIGKFKIAGSLLIILIALLMLFGWSIYFAIDRFVIEQLASNEAQKAKIVNLQLQSDSNIPSENSYDPIFSQHDNIYVCGDLDAKEKVPLSIYWLRLPDKDVVYQNPYDEGFDAGYFCSELKQTLSPGHYQVDVYYARINLGTIQFTIIE